MNQGGRAESAILYRAHGDLTLNGLPADVRLRVKEFPVLGTVTLYNGDTGGLL